MEIKHTYSNKITYDLSVAYASDRIVILLETEDLKIITKYKKIFNTKEMAAHLRRQFSSTKELFQFMGTEDNFTVDPMNGRIVLQIRS